MKPVNFTRVSMYKQNGKLNPWCTKIVPTNIIVSHGKIIDKNFWINLVNTEFMTQLKERNITETCSHKYNS